MRSIDSSHSLPPRRGYSALRRSRVSEPGRVYFLTFVVRQREPLFRNTTAAAVMAEALADHLLAGANRFHAWVVMPDHVHALVSLSAANSLPVAVARIKSGSSRRVNVAIGRHGALWAPGYHEHALRADEQLAYVAEYILMNPVRAGIVARLGEYPFAWSEWMP